MDERHKNRDKYFKEQGYTCRNHIIPFITIHKKIDSNTKVLEVGCGYGGNLVPFLELGCKVTGVDIREGSIDDAKSFLNNDYSDQLELICSDIYKVEGLENKFDVIFMKDTIEHIPNQEAFLPLLKKFLKDDGVIFQGFPPWCNPFGGHQQMCVNKFLSRLPWFHLTPRWMFKGILKLFREHPKNIENLLIDVYDTGISVQRFLKICKKNNMPILESKFYLINPNYEIKFNLKPRVLPKYFQIPYLRDFYTTTVYCLITK
ncbi:MAG: hypothetical protein RI883_723 [Bacteroidota bacterium]|jgi:SAM-dependent methyltransferase